MNQKNWPYSNAVNPNIYSHRTDWPKISIVTPSFNQGKFIEETILSILNQNYPNLEYIIIDGGSTDDTVEVIKKYENRISYWVSEKDEGQTHAINKGFKKATGKIGNWLNSDDILEKNALFYIADEFEKTDAYIVVGNSIHWNYNNGINYEHTTSPTKFSDLLFYYKLICIAQPSAFYKLFLIKDKLCLNLKLHYTMDLDLWLRMGILIGVHTKINHLDKLLSRMRIHPNQKTSIDNWRAMQEAQYVLLQHSTAYGYSLSKKMRLRFNVRLMRYNNALEIKDRRHLILLFPDVIFYKVINKINGYFNNNSNSK